VVTEQDKTLETLQIAIQMELDGKEYCLKVSLESSNELGKKLLQSLAAEEDIHRRIFGEIYEAIRNKKVWPITDFQSGGGQGLRAIFSRATEEMDSTIKVSTTEFDAIQKAMDMENKTYDFYKNQLKNVACDAGRDFYEAPAAQERGHHMVLLDY
tara:strand:+ start:590 stop:1054 length:465 start_codon:yes stop_codon:yes gene_type:complete